MTNLSKCVFGTSEAEFLGNIISKHGVRLLPAKLNAVVNVPQPTSQCNLREILGLLNFYWRFLPTCVKIVLPLNNLLRGTTGAPADLEWNTLRRWLSLRENIPWKTPLLVRPKQDAPTSVMSIRLATPPAPY